MRKLIAILSLAFIAACSIADSAEYTLYRTGIDVTTQTHVESHRIHVATFDATAFNGVEDNAKYNLANCEFAQELFNASQSHYRGSIYSTIKIKYWCEKGRFRK